MNERLLAVQREIICLQRTAERVIPYRRTPVAGVSELELVGSA